MAKKQAKMSDLQSIADLLPDTRNANKGTERGTGLIEDSLRRLGAGRSVVADRNGRLIAGNKTAQGCRDIGLEKIRVVQTQGDELVVVQRMDLDLEKDKAARELAIVDNRAGQVSLEWDMPQLESLATDYGIDLSDVGFSSLDIENLGGSEVPEATEDEIPEASTVPQRCKAGDLWRLGSHRLLCGDSTNAEDVKRLLDGSVPFIMVTDPPYGVNYDASWREKYDQFERHSTGLVENDDRNDWTETYSLFPGTVAYVWHASYYTPEVGLNLKSAGFQIRASIIWRKQHFVFGQGHYHWQHEPCWYVVRKGASSKWCGDRKQSTIWDIENKNPMGGKQDDENTSHGTQKPVECMARPIRNHGDKADDVYDPFGGSGTTLIACEQLGRKCFMLEISPLYCDVILARWEKLTGKKAEKISA